MSRRRRSRTRARERGDRVSRRELLVALVAASGCSGEGIPTETPAADGFPCGVSSADATPTQALLWTRYEGDRPLFAEWWPLDDEARRQRVAAPFADQLAQVDATGLEAGRRYAFHFTDGERTSDTGHFRAALSADALEPVTFAAMSCALQTMPLRPLTAVAKAYELDAFLVLGDAVYADGATNRAEFDAEWRFALARAPNRAMRQATSTIATWDDHETEDNTSPDSTLPALAAAARESFLANQPIRPDVPGRIWRSRRWGRTVEVFVLDCRSERHLVPGEYVSRAQLDWLKSGIENSPAVFKVILNSVPIGNYDSALFGAFAHDRWDGHPAQKREVLEFIDAHRAGVLWLTGDFHIGIAGRIALEGVGAEQLEIAVGPAGASPNPALSYPTPPQFDYASAINNVVVLDLDPKARTARVRFVDGDERVLFDRVYTP